MCCGVINKLISKQVDNVIASGYALAMTGREQVDKCTSEQVDKCTNSSTRPPDGTITQKMISTDIMDLSSLSRGDISNVIESLIATMPKYLLMGKSIKLGDFGTLRLSFSSDGVDEAKDFNTNMIRGVKVVFTPSPEFKLALERITFEKSE